MDFTTRLARKCGWEHTEKPEWTFLATDSFCFKNNFPSELQGQCPRLLTCWLNHAMVCNIQILFTTFVFHTLSWKKSKYAQNRWWQRFARAKSIKIYISVFPPPNKKRTLKSPLSPLIIKSTCLMTKQRLKIRGLLPRLGAKPTPSRPYTPLEEEGLEESCRLSADFHLPGFPGRGEEIHCLCELGR